MSILNKPYFRNDKAAFAYLEGILWADGVSCPHCGSVDRSGKLAGVKDKKGRVRLGLWKCYECRKQFRCTVGTVFESAHIPLHKVLQAVYLMSASKKGVSAHQLHRTLEITYKSAWFLAHRIREAMRDGTLAPMGGSGKVVEADETYFGFQQGMSKKKASRIPTRHGSQYRNIVMTLVSREGSARSFIVAGTATSDLVPIIRTNIRRESALMTDEAKWYKPIGKEFASHASVNHQKFEFARGEVSTNTVEGYFSIFKRGMKGIYQHCAEKHLHRYLAEYDFRYSNRVALGVNDVARSERALKGMVGKRLTYRRTGEVASI
jgi:transposase-like protein